YALNYDEKLSFTKGLSTDEEPEIWQKSDDGQTLLWIDLGLIEPERIKKATRQAKQVVIYTYQGKDLKNWIDKCRGNIGSASNLQVFDIGNEAAESLAKLHNKAMNLTVMRDENDVWVSDDSQSVHIELKSLCKDSVFIE
ncbi:MAG: YaeQ family protein, partial [Oceanobacter sp.]